MTNIFGSLKIYLEKWEVKETRSFNEEELQAIKGAEVVPSDYGLSVCFTMVSGGRTFIPLSETANAAIGDTIDPKSVSIVTLSRVGDADIYRIDL